MAKMFYRLESFYHGKYHSDYCYIILYYHGILIFLWKLKENMAYILKNIVFACFSNHLEMYVPVDN